MSSTAGFFIVHDDHNVRELGALNRLMRGELSLTI